MVLDRDRQCLGNGCHSLSLRAPPPPHLAVGGLDIAGKARGVHQRRCLHPPAEGRSQTAQSGQIAGQLRPRCGHIAPGGIWRRPVPAGRDSSVGQARPAPRPSVPRGSRPARPSTKCPGWSCVRCRGPYPGRCPCRGNTASTAAGAGWPTNVTRSAVTPSSASRSSVPWRCVPAPARIVSREPRRSLTPGPRASGRGD